jgi:hypothetical protein
VVGELEYVNPLRNIGRRSLRFPISSGEDGRLLHSLGKVYLHDSRFYLWLAERANHIGGQSVS